VPTVGHCGTLIFSPCILLEISSESLVNSDCWKLSEMYKCVEAVGVIHNEYMRAQSLSIFHRNCGCASLRMTLSNNKSKT
jgi:hypothetical protein